MLYLYNTIMNLISFFSQKIKQVKGNIKGILKNPRFYFGLFTIFLLYGVCFGIDNISGFNETLKNKDIFLNSFFDNNDRDDLFINNKKFVALETPDFKITDNNFIFGLSSYRVLTPQVLGAIFGEDIKKTNEVIEYKVLPGDTIETIAKNFEISTDTIIWANNLTKNSTIKVGQSLVILPVSGLIHIVKSGDTISDISKTYKSKIEEIVVFNNLTNQGDIFIGDILVVPGGTMPQKQTTTTTKQPSTPLANNYFIIPAEGTISQKLHWYNAIDVANKCGTPVYAAALGVVQRVKYGWNSGGGNYVTILHNNGVVTYYGHLLSIFVKPGDSVATGDRIGLMGGQPGTTGAGISTGCHLHFDVIGGQNPLAKYLLGAKIKY